MQLQQEFFRLIHLSLPRELQKMLQICDNLVKEEKFDISVEKRHQS